MSDMWLYEKSAFERGLDPVCGCDEAGAGPLAGPVYAAAVILPHGLEIAGLTDSKKLSAKKREALYDIIVSSALSYAIASVGEREIDEINILNARMKAMDMAIRALDIVPALALIDGNRSSGISAPCETIVGGDGKSASIAAASILAKVGRDRYMDLLAERYPEYHFDRHKGYGTKLHYEMIKKHGVLEVHRKAFLKKMH